MSMSLWCIFISVRMLLVLGSLFSLVMLQGIWPQYFSVVIFIWNYIHIFYLNFKFWFSSQQLLLHMGPHNERDFGSLPLRIHEAQKATVSFRTHTGLLYSLALRVVIEFPMLPQTCPLCFLVSFSCLFRILPVVKCVDNHFALLC